jgi:Kinase binding protein CGI-121
VDVFQVQVAANIAVNAWLSGTMITHNIHSEVIYNLCPARNVGVLFLLPLSLFSSLPLFSSLLLSVCLSVSAVLRVLHSSHATGSAHLPRGHVHRCSPSSWYAPGCAYALLQVAKSFRAFGAGPRADRALLGVITRTTAEEEKLAARWTALTELLKGEEVSVTEPFPYDPKHIAKVWRAFTLLTLVTSLV